MLSIFLREICMLCRNLPVNTEAVIEDADAAICLWMIEVVALVLEDSSL